MYPRGRHYQYCLGEWNESRENVRVSLSSIGPSLARSREARFACPNRRACSQAITTTLIRAIIEPAGSWPTSLGITQFIYSSHLHRTLIRAIYLPMGVFRLLEISLECTFILFLSWLWFMTSRTHLIAFRSYWFWLPILFAWEKPTLQSPLPMFWSQFWPKTVKPLKWLVRTGF